MSDDSSIVVTFTQSRTTEGTDVSALIRAAWPEADITAILDDDGAVTGYRVTVKFPDADSTADAAFRLRDELAELGLPAEWS
jgi:hypothetical protein